MESRSVEEQRNALREQNEKLQGSIRSQDMIIQRLSKEEKSLFDKMNEYKKAFEDIFDKNAAGAWESYSETLKEEGKDPEEIPLSEKVAFFNKTINDTRLYVLHTAIRKAKEDLASESSTFIKKADEMEERVAVLEGCLAEIINKCRMTNLFSDPTKDSVKGICMQLADVETKDMKDGSSFRMMVLGQLKGGGKVAPAPEHPNPSVDKETTTATPPKSVEPEPEPEEPDVATASATEILYAAYKEFIEKTPESNITEDTPDWQEAIMLIVKNHVASEIIAGKGINLKNPDGTPNPDGVASLQLWFKSIGVAVAEIAETGQSREALLKKLLEPKIEKKILKDIFPLCEALGLTTAIDGASIGKGRPTKNHVLTYLGKILHHYNSKQEEKEFKLRDSRITNSSGGADEKSKQHAALIGKTEELLESYGYDYIDEDEQKLEGTNKSSICDILASKNGTEIRIECEIGNGNTQKYKEKVEKIFAIGCPWALFIAPDVPAAKSLGNMFRDGVGSQLALKRKGQEWLVLSFEEFKAKLDGDADWLVTHLRELKESKSKAKGAVLSSKKTASGFGEWDGMSGSFG